MNGDLLRQVDALSREKGIDKESVFRALEMGLTTAARKRVGPGRPVEAKLDRMTGQLTYFERWRVVDEVEFPEEELELDAARAIDEAAEVGGEVHKVVMVTSLGKDLGRIEAQTVKQVLLQRVREAERDRVVSDFTPRIGEVITGVVKRVDHRGVMVDIGRIEAIVEPDDLIPRDSFRQGDRIRALIARVKRTQKGPQIFLSRSHNNFLVRLYEMEVPEIREGFVQIKAVARDPGRRAKMAVYTPERGIDPIGACIGPRGSRVQAVVGELQGERIDIIEWSSDAAAFVLNAMAPAEVAKVVVDEDEHAMEVVVTEEQYPIAIGRGGQNVNLASKLTGWRIDVLTEEESVAQQEEEIGALIQTFIDALQVDEDLALVLVEEGFNTIEEIAYVPMEEMMAIDGMEEEIANELRNRARDFLLVDALRREEKLRDLGVTPELIEMEGMTEEIAVAIGQGGVKEVDDLAELAIDELIEMVPGMKKAQASRLIMKARESWFSDEEQGQEAETAQS